MSRPGPRSTKRNVILRKRGSLGDTTEDDSSVDRTSEVEKENRGSNFRSPEAETNATDYGLEFTTSYARNLSPRRCSTFRTASSQEEQLASAERAKRRTRQSVSKESKKENANKLTKELTALRGGDSDDSASDEEEDGSNRLKLTEEKLARAERASRRTQQTVSKDPKKQNTSKQVRQQAPRENDDDSASAEEEEEGSARSHLPDKQLERAEVSKGRQQKHIASKNQRKQNASKATKEKQTASGESATDEDEEESSEGNHSKEDNRLSTEAQGNSKKPTKTKQHPSKPEYRPATKNSAPHERSQQAPMSSAPSGSTTAKQKSQERPHQLSKQEVAVKKPRKQLNPIQRERRFWREVKALQKRCDNILPRLPFSRVIRQIMMEASQDVNRITPTALEALQTASEMYLTQRLQDAYMLTLHRGRVTLDARDMELINYLQMNM